MGWINFYDIVAFIAMIMAAFLFLFLLAMLITWLIGHLGESKQATKVGKKASLIAGILVMGFIALFAIGAGLENYQTNRMDKRYLNDVENFEEKSKNVHEIITDMDESVGEDPISDSDMKQLNRGIGDLTLTYTQLLDDNTGNYKISLYKKYYKTIKKFYNYVDKADNDTTVGEYWLDTAKITTDESNQYHKLSGYNE